LVRHQTRRSGCKGLAPRPSPRLARRASRRRLRRLSRCFFTWRRMSSAISWIECSMSGEASSARRVTPLSARVASATILSAIRGFFSSRSSTSRVASAETCLPARWNLWTTASVTSTFLPRTSIFMIDVLPSGWPFDATPAIRAGQVARSADGARERQGDDPAAAALAQGPRAGRERGAGGPDVVDEQGLAGRVLRQGDPWRVGEALRSPAPHLSPASATPQADAEWPAAGTCDRDRDLLARIEAAPTPAPGPGGH